MSLSARSLLPLVVVAMLLFCGCRWVRTALGLLPAATTGAGVDAATDIFQDRPAPTFARVEPILRRACTDACHDGRGMAADDFVFVDTGDLRQRLLGPPPATAPPQCHNRPLVVPGDPDVSLLVVVIEEPESPRAGCAERMPHSCPDRRPCITGTELRTIRDWITAGALP